MAFTTINKSTDYFNTKLYTGTGATLNITGLDFQPDFSWLKVRSNADNHALFDAVRGATKRLASNLTAVESNRATALTSFNSDGFTLGDNSETNTNNYTYASWNWLGANGTAANTDGDIASTVSANTTSGFSIVSYTGNGTSGATVGHGLSSKPGMMIFKERNGTTSWVVYHHKNTSAPATEYLQLNSSNATGDYAGYFNDTEPTSSVFTLGNDTGINQSGDTYIAYCFAEKQGYSKFGSYVGNGSADGTFVYTGFKPAFVISKCINIANNWVMTDTKRSTYNITANWLGCNVSDAEGAYTYYDILSNGFKARNTSGWINSGDASLTTDGNTPTYIYMAFAEAPLVGTNNIPANAR